MKVHLINPSAFAFGVGVITPRWLYVLAAATPEKYGDPIITDETLDPWDPSTVSAGDVVGIGIHTGNAVRRVRHRQEVARARGAYVVYGGIHATLYPDEAMTLGEAHAIVKGDGDLVWAQRHRGLRPRARRCRCTTAARSRAAISNRRGGR